MELAWVALLVLLCSAFQYGNHLYGHKPTHQERQYAVAKVVDTLRKVPNMGYQVRGVLVCPSCQGRMVVVDLIKNYLQHGTAIVETHGFCKKCGHSEKIGTSSRNFGKTMVWQQGERIA